MDVSSLINDGFVIVDKPPDMICHEVTSWVGRILGSSKAGHAGTLDPNVSGVLPIGLGRATKLLRFISGGIKTYIGIVEFPFDVDEERVNKIFSSFIGKIAQVPPKISAVAKRKRYRRVYELKPIEIEGRFVLFKAVVEAGTYIRVLCKDMGGKMVDLRRTAVGNIGEDKAVVLQRLFNEFYAWKRGLESDFPNLILSPEEMFDLIGIKKVYLKRAAAVAVSGGAQLAVPGIVKWDEFNEGEYVAMFFNNTLIGVGKALIPSSKLSSIEKGIVLKTLRIHRRIE